MTSPLKAVFPELTWHSRHPRVLIVTSELWAQEGEYTAPKGGRSPDSKTLFKSRDPLTRFLTPGCIAQYSG